MKRPSFRFYPDNWMNNRALRMCSPAARAFWIDLLCIMHPSGYLTINDKPLDVNQIATLVGGQIKDISKWLQELGEAGIYHVDDDGRLFSSKMVKESVFKKQAKTSGKRGGRKPNKTIVLASTTVPAGMAHANDPIGVVLEVENIKNNKPPVIRGKAVPWYETKAGWARKGGEVAVPYSPGEDYAEYQCKVAAKIPAGKHLEVLTKAQQARVEALTPKQ